MWNIRVTVVPIITTGKDGQVTALSRPGAGAALAGLAGVFAPVRHHVPTPPAEIQGAAWARVGAALRQGMAAEDAKRRA